MHNECIPHRIPRAWEQQEWSKKKKADTRIIVNSMKYGIKDRVNYKGKSPKQGLASAKDLTMELSGGCEIPLP